MFDLMMSFLLKRLGESLIYSYDKSKRDVIRPSIHPTSFGISYSVADLEHWYFYSAASRLVTPITRKFIITALEFVGFKEIKPVVSDDKTKSEDFEFSND